MLRTLAVLLLLLPLLTSAGEFDVPRGRFHEATLSDGIGAYPAHIVCTYQFRQVRFSEDWGPGFVLTIRAQDELKPFIQFRVTVTSGDDRYVFSYRQGFEGGSTPWVISYLVAPYAAAVEIKTTVELYGNGVLDYSTSVDGKIFGNGRVFVPGLAVERVTATASSAAGKYSCEGL